MIDYEEGEDEIEDVEFNVDDAENLDPDHEFENECCFWLMKALRGGNIGRKTKRLLFKISAISIIVNFSLLIITGFEG
jgi:hypothetical protein